MAVDFIQSQRFLFGDLSDRIGQLEELYMRKLWFQLTAALLDFVKDPLASRGDNLIQLYERFVSTFEARINQLHLVFIVTQVAAQFYPSRPYVPAELDRAIAFLCAFKDAKRGRLGSEAYLAVSMEVTTLRLRRAAAAAAAGADAAALADALDECKREVAAGRESLDALPDGIDAAVPAAVHRAAAEYYRIRGPAAAFYEAAMLWLGAAPLEGMPAEARAALAVDVALAALVGEGVYNFGEVNAHPLLQSLGGSPHAWLGELLATFQTGDIDRFNAVVGAHKAAFDAQPALVAGSAAIKEKITLLAVMELASSKPPAQRAITFAELAAHTHLPLEQMEWVLMRALSQGLIRGKIDQVAGLVHVSFVKPRVLDAAQVGVLQARVDAWRARGHAMLLFLEGHTRELLG